MKREREKTYREQVDELRSQLALALAELKRLETAPSCSLESILGPYDESVAAAARSFHGSLSGRSLPMP